MADLPQLFHFDEGPEGFEDLAVKHGMRLWSEATLMAALGYVADDSFKQVIHKAQHACLSLDIEIEENFVRQADATHLFTRFACYLIAINGDSQKPQVAAAQVYFAALAHTFQTALEHSQAVDRVLIREEVSHGEKSLSSSASRHGVENYSFFQNAGYRGMYNMNLKALKLKKGVKGGESLIDRMDRTELAAHLFRITQTDEKIKRVGATGQLILEEIAKTVGKQVRKSMIEISGQKPELIPLAEPIAESKKKLKAAGKQFRELDHQTTDGESADRTL